jgi:hypothetical protein
VKKAAAAWRGRNGKREIREMEIELRPVVSTAPAGCGRCDAVRNDMDTHMKEMERWSDKK